MSVVTVPFAEPRKTLILCADDYALSPGVSLGIRQLAEAGRISATGAMTCMPYWSSEAPALRALVDRVQVGLHFTLTDQRPLGPMPHLAADGRFPSVGRLLKRSLLGGMPSAEVAAELERQLDAFEAAFGRPPDFIDGHQHVHVLPGVRGAVLAAFGRRLDPSRCWLRDCADGWARLAQRRQAVKAGIIAALSYGFARQARVRGISCNRGFSGFYDAERQGLAEVFSSLLAGAGDGHLVMVHPGHVDAELRAVDSLTTPREKEWAFLSGGEFPRLLAEHGFVLRAEG